MEFISLLGLAFWIGLLTSISPCPLASNIAAISFVSYRVSSKGYILISSILYTLGRSMTYVIVAFLVIQTMFSIPSVSNFLQEYMGIVLGPILILIGLILLDIFRFNLININFPERLVKNLPRIGLFGSFLLGGLFALTFCPISAALFFGSLIPLSLKTNSSLILPVFYGFGTGIPVLIFGLLTVFGLTLLNNYYQKVIKFELYMQKTTGIIFILVGLYYLISNLDIY